MCLPMPSNRLLERCTGACARSGAVRTGLEEPGAGAACATVAARAANADEPAAAALGPGGVGACRACRRGEEDAVLRWARMAASRGVGDASEAARNGEAVKPSAPTAIAAAAAGCRAVGAAGLVPGDPAPPATRRLPREASAPVP